MKATVENSPLNDAQLLLLQAFAHIKSRAYILQNVLHK